MYNVFDPFKVNLYCYQPDTCKVRGQMVLKLLCAFCICVHPRLNVGVFGYHPLGGSTSTGRVEGLLARYEMLLALNQLHGQPWLLADWLQVVHVVVHAEASLV